jgi:hypothetical protein
MNASHDIGSTMQGAPKVHPEAPCLFIAESFHGDQAMIELKQGITKWVGEEIAHSGNVYHANICFFIALPGGTVSQYNWACIKTFFDRFGKEARVYEFLRIQKFFRARDVEYFLTPGRVQPE